MSDKSKLTPRETRILGLMARGYFNKQIAATFQTTEQTIKNYVSKILMKLNAANRAEAVIKAASQGIVPLERD